MAIPRLSISPLFVGGWWLVATVPAMAQTVNHTTIGLTDLLNRYGASAPNGSSVSVWQVEAGSPGNTFPGASVIPNGYVPFDGTGISGHAAQVGAEWYGPGTGIAQAVPYVWTMEAGQFVFPKDIAPPPLIAPLALNSFSTFLPTIPSTQPVRPAPQVLNASWVGRFSAQSGYTAAELGSDVLRRLDYLVDVKKVTAVVALDNVPAIPQLLAQSHNSIAVGLSNLSAGQGYSDLDGSGRMVVDLVAPSSFTSFATPAVAGAATLLVDRANKTPALADAADPMVVRSLLMTGAQKLPGWQHGDAGTADDIVHPLDKIQGAGELRINKSYDILMAGEKAVGSHSVGMGWSLASIAKGGVQYYYVDNLVAGGTLTVTLNWNRTTSGVVDDRFLIDGDPLANLDLELYSSDNLDTIGSSLARSASTLDNVEHIYLQGLAAGRFAIAVQGVDAATYALSFEIVPESSTMGAGVGAMLLAAASSWRRFNVSGRKTASPDRSRTGAPR